MQLKDFALQRILLPLECPLVLHVRILNLLLVVCQPSRLNNVHVEKVVDLRVSVEAAWGGPLRVLGANEDVVRNRVKQVLELLLLLLVHFDLKEQICLRLVVHIEAQLQQCLESDCLNQSR